MDKKVYLICQRHLISVRKNRVIWSDWYPVSQKSLYSSLDEAVENVEKLRSRAYDNGFENVDYCYKLMFLK